VYKLKSHSKVFNYHLLQHCKACLHFTTSFFTS